MAVISRGLCLAMALAFGLGSREVAGEIVRRRWDRVRNRSVKAGGVPPVAPPVSSPATPAGGKPPGTTPSP